MDYASIMSVFIRSIVTLVVLFILAKVMGKKQISQLNIFDYIIGITIGSVGADISLDLNKHFIDGIVCLVTFGLFGAFVSFITLKSIRLRRLFSGTPSMLIEDGKIIEDGLKKVRFDINDLMEEMRNAGYFDISSIAYAIMETSGRVSFLPKDDSMPITKKDIDLKIVPSSLVCNAIIDGNIMINNLRAINKDREWMMHELKVMGKKLDDILLATVDSNYKVSIYEKGIKSKYDTIFE